jgi:phage N-6-adenine-methyltransferase
MQKTAERIAKESNISAPTVRRYADDAEFFVHLEEEEPEIAAKVWSGEEKLSKVKKAHVSNNSGENEWYTPAHIIEAARATMGTIDTDPASSEFANRTVQAGMYYTKEIDGLMQSWGGNVWMNPPYAQPLIADFCKKLAEEVESGNTKQFCVLVNNATDTSWFRGLVTIAHGICFTNGRIKFIDKNGNPSGAPLQGQAIIYNGENYATFKEKFKDIGWIVKKEE